MNPFEEKLAAHRLVLRRARLQTLQVKKSISALRKLNPSRFGISISGGIARLTVRYTVRFTFTSASASGNCRNTDAGLAVSLYSESWIKVST